jgi:hypothetical protein
MYTEWNSDIIEVSDRNIKENFKPFPVRHCDDCNRSYEMDGKVINYHIDFPSYGIERKTCINC